MQFFEGVHNDSVCTCVHIGECIYIYKYLYLYYIS
jgi:hypothetical protein